MFRSTFTDHPAQAGETYAEHLTFAVRFGLTLIGAGCAAIVHALVPCLFTSTAGDAVQRLARMVAERRRQPHLQADAAVPYA